MQDGAEDTDVLLDLLGCSSEAVLSALLAKCIKRFAERGFKGRAAEILFTPLQLFFTRH